MPKIHFELFLAVLTIPLSIFAQNNDAVERVSSGSNTAVEISESEAMPTAAKNIKNAQTLLGKLNLQSRPIHDIQVSTKGNKSTAIRATDTHGNLQFVATIKGNHLHGSFAGYYASGGRLDSGSFSYNLPDGLWQTWHPNGQLLSVVHYDAQKWQAVHQELLSGNIKTGFHRHALPKTVASLRGFDKLTTSQQAAEGYLSPFKIGLLHGIAKSYFANGQLKDSGSYYYGVKHDLWMEWHPNGQKKSQGVYKKGEKWGGWSHYNTAGTLETLNEFKQGRLIHQKQYRRPQATSK